MSLRFLTLAFFITALFSAHVPASAPADVLPFGLNEAVTNTKASPSTSTPTNQFAKGFAHHVSSRSHGEWRFVDDGYREFARWEYTARAPDALSLSVHFGELNLPSGTTLRLTSDRGATETIKSHDAEAGLVFSSPLEGDELTFSLTAPRAVAENVHVEILQWNVGFRELSDVLNRGARTKAQTKSVSREDINYDCIGPASTEAVSQSTVGIIVNGAAACSANLINHPDADSRAFIISAGHCADALEDEGVDPTRVAAFFQQITSCEDGRENGMGIVGTVNQDDRRDGVAIVYRDPDADFGGDTMVVELESYPSASVNPYLSGYDGTGANEPTAGDLGVIVHHAGQRHQQYWNEPYLSRGDASLTFGGEPRRRSEYYFFENEEGNLTSGASGSGLHREDLRLIGVTAGSTSDVAVFSPLDLAMDNGLAASFGNVLSMSGREAPAASAPTVTVNATPSSVGNGESFTISWQSSDDAVGCEAFGSWSGGLGTSGSEELSAPSNDTARTVTDAFGVRCENDRGATGEGSADVSRVPDAPGVSLLAASSSVSEGEEITLDWSTDRALSCEATGDWGGNKSIDGSESVGPFSGTGSRTFNLVCSNDGGSSTDSVTVNVQEPEDVALTFSGPATVNTGSLFTLEWTADNADACVASGDWSGSYPAQGSDTLSAGNNERTLQFTLSCSGAGASDSRTVSVEVVEPDPVSVSLSAPAMVSVGDPIPLQWSSANADSCSASGSWGGARPVSGSAEVGPFDSAGDRVFRLRCDGEPGSATDQVTVTVVEQTPAPTLNMSAPQEVEVGESFAISYTSSNADACEASGAWSGEGLRPSSSENFTFQSPGSRTFGLTCTGAGGSTSAERTVNVIPAPAPVSVTTNVDRDEVTSGDLVTIEWESTNAAQCEASDDLSDVLSNPVDRNGFAEVRLENAGTVDLTIVCTGGDGDTDRSTSRVTVLDGGNGDPVDPPGGGTGGDGGGSGGGSFGLGALMLGLGALLRRFRFEG